MDWVWNPGTGGRTAQNSGFALPPCMRPGPAGTDGPSRSRTPHYRRATSARCNGAGCPACRVGCRSGTGHSPEGGRTWPMPARGIHRLQMIPTRSPPNRLRGSFPTARRQRKRHLSCCVWCCMSAGMVKRHSAKRRQVTAWVLSSSQVLCCCEALSSVEAGLGKDAGQGT